MADGSLGLTEAVSIALGGMIGGGIFAVLGVVAQMAHGATWLAFVIAGIVALCTGYSFTALNDLSDEQGGAVTFIQCFLGNSTLAGMAGWTLLFGYIGSMAMYAFAFGSYAVGFRAISAHIGGYPLRPLVSTVAVAGFVGLNLRGARATGAVENLLVGAKVAIILVFGLGGILYGLQTGTVEYGTAELPSFSPIMAAGVSFVAFQGWQLLFYDQERFEDPEETIRTATYGSILTAVGLYIIVAITTVSLAPLQAIRTNPEQALAVAADPFIPHGFVIISLAALFSTGSAINATLFSAGYFTKGMLSADLVPDRVGDANADGLSARTILGLGVIVAAFTAVGSLEAITSFASLTFIVVFGSVSYLAYRKRDHPDVHGIVPAAGTVGATAFFLLMLVHLFREEPGTFWALGLLALSVLAVETLYFEREVLEEEVETIDELIEKDVGTTKEA